MITSTSNGSYQATSFFVDSSGHSNFILPLDLKFGSREDLDLFLSSKSIRPLPQNQVEDQPDGTVDNDKPDSSGKSASDAHVSSATGKSSVGFEARCISGDVSERNVVVEAITILKTRVENLTICLETEITVRASGIDASHGEKSTPNPSSLKVDIEITPVLIIENHCKDPGSSVRAPDLLALELGAIPDHMQKETNARIHEARLDPVLLQLVLSPAFSISVDSVPGGSMGNTMISLTIRHSNLHREPVTINNLAIHPGSSRYETRSSERGKFVSKYSVSKLKWSALNAPENICSLTRMWTVLNG